MLPRLLVEKSNRACLATATAWSILTERQAASVNELALDHEKPADTSISSTCRASDPVPVFAVHVAVHQRG